jgi:predicted CxxxxCH...CXXCH cytochrome family protein
MDGRDTVEAGSRITVAGRLIRLGLVAALGIGFGIMLSARPAVATTLLHNTADTGSTKYNFGSDYTCDTCHTKSKGTTTNIKKVLDQISTSIGRRPVIFNKIPNNGYNNYTTTSNAVTGIFGNDERTVYKEGSRNICEVCHHNTIYHNYSVSKLGSQIKHPEHQSNKKDCNQCHKHALGYRAPNPKNCTDCHGVPPTSPGSMVAGTYTLGISPPADAGAHNRHRNVEGMECFVCHNNYGHGLLGNMMIEIGFRIDKKTWAGFSGISTVMGGTYTGTIGAPFTNDFAVPAGNPNTTLLRVAGENSCDVYCHGGGGSSIWKVPSGRTNTKVSWTAGPLGDCSTSACHGTTSANPPTPALPGAHTRHVGDLQMACTRCHDDYGTPPHMINGRIKWNLTGQGTNAKYKGFQAHSTAKVLMADPYGKCTNVYCHSNVQDPVTGVGGFTKYTTVTWGGNTALGCSGCHGGLKSSGANAIASGAHAKHISTYSYACAECHKGAGADGSLMNHLNSNIEVIFGRYSGSYGGMPTNVPGDGYNSCSANYCHSDGKGAKKTIGWGAGPQPCTACHQITGISTGKHAAHVNNDAFLGTSYGCVVCHASTVTDNSTLAADLSKHVNKFGDYSGLRAGKYTPATGSCTASYCHSDGKGNPPPVAFNWNDGSTINDCKGCHGVATSAGFVSAVGEPNYVNTGAGTNYANSHDKHMGGIGLYTCVYCHDDTVTSAGLKNGTLHLNGTKNVKAGGGKSFNYPSARTCNNISCHGGPNEAIWGQQFELDCTGCHNGNEYTAPFQPISSGRHLSHVSPSNNVGQLGRGFRCAECHALTANPDDRSIADTSVHGNGFKNYTGKGAGGRSSYATATGICSNAYCHSDGKGTKQVIDATNGWKSAKTVKFNCLTCHGSSSTVDFVSQWGEPNYPNGGVGTLRANDHKNHADSIASCGYCHADTVTTTGLILANTTTHANRRLDVRAGNGKIFDYAARTCSNISCHGGKGAFSVEWGTVPNPECTGCHGGNALTTSPYRPISSGRHKAHINNAATLGMNYSCYECHAQTVATTDRTFSTASNHGNGLLNYSGAKAGKVYTSVDGNCSNTYCHSNGKGVIQTFTLGTGWKSTTVFVNCVGCHGTSADFVSAAGEPNYTSGTAGSPSANSHKVHVGTAGATTCYYCHADVVGTTGTTVNAKHINRLITYSTSSVSGKTFTRGAGKTCSNIACHGAGSPVATWGGLPLACNSCHGDGTSLTTGKHAAHTNNAAHIGNNLGCVDCHAQVVSNDTAFSNRALHANGFTNVSGALAGKDSATCNAAYCHSNGKGAAGLPVNWSSTPAFANCNGCHGTSNTAGYPDYPNSGAAGSSTSNSHLSHTTKLAWTGAASCELCHFQTVTSAGTAILPTGRHLNGTSQIGNDVVFNTTKAGSATYNPALRSCSNTTCHGTPAPVWGDASSAGCKTCHSNLGGAHAAHVGTIMTDGLVTFYNYTGNRSAGTAHGFGCATCHPMVAGTYHQNGTYGDIDLSSNATGIGQLRKLNTQITAAGTGYTKASSSDFRCNLVYCHSDGRNTTSPVYRQSPNWYGGPFTGNRCGMCHDNPPQYATGGGAYNSHYVAASTLGNNGRTPVKESGHMVGIHFKFTAKGGVKNGFLGFSSSGSMAHGNSDLATTVSCVTCHSGIVSPTKIDTYAMNGTSSLYRCGNCHTASTRTPLQSGQIVDTARHVNGIKDVAFPVTTFKTKAQLTSQANALGWQRSGNYKDDNSYDSFALGTSSWDPQTRTCLTACHVNQPNITWGAQLQCFSCHANQ